MVGRRNQVSFDLEDEIDHFASQFLQLLLSDMKGLSKGQILLTVVGLPVTQTGDGGMKERMTMIDPDETLVVVERKTGGTDVALDLHMMIDTEHMTVFLEDDASFHIVWSYYSSEMV